MNDLCSHAHAFVFANKWTKFREQIIGKGSCGQTCERTKGILSACVTAVKYRPVLHHCVVIFFWSSGIIDCMFVYIWKLSSAHALGWGRQWCGIFHYHLWTVSIKPMLLFSHAGLYLSSVYLRLATRFAIGDTHLLFI